MGPNSVRNADDSAKGYTNQENTSTPHFFNLDPSIALTNPLKENVSIFHFFIFLVLGVNFPTIDFIM